MKNLYSHLESLFSWRHKLRAVVFLLVYVCAVALVTFGITGRLKPVSKPAANSGPHVVVLGKNGFSKSSVQLCEGDELGKNGVVRPQNFSL